jgi:hypothetical protein
VYISGLPIYVAVLAQEPFTLTTNLSTILLFQDDQQALCSAEWPSLQAAHQEGWKAKIGVKALQLVS